MIKKNTPQYNKDANQSRGQLLFSYHRSIPYSSESFTMKTLLLNTEASPKISKEQDLIRLKFLPALKL